MFFRGYIYKDSNLKGSLRLYVFTMTKYTIVMIVAAITTYICCSCVHSSYKLIVLGVRATLCIVIPNGIWLMIYHNSPEFAFVWNKVRRKVMR